MNAGDPALNARWERLWVEEAAAPEAAPEAPPPEPTAEELEAARDAEAARALASATPAWDVATLPTLGGGAQWDSEAMTDLALIAGHARDHGLHDLANAIVATKDGIHAASHETPEARVQVVQEREQQDPRGWQRDIDDAKTLVRRVKPLWKGAAAVEALIDKSVPLTTPLARVQRAMGEAPLPDPLSRLLQALIADEHEEQQAAR